MPRIARASGVNLCYHVLNRGNNRARIFHKDGDFDAFVDLLAEAKLRDVVGPPSAPGLTRWASDERTEIREFPLTQYRTHWKGSRILLGERAAQLSRQRLHHGVALIAGLVQNQKILGVGSVFVVN